MAALELASQRFTAAATGSGLPPMLYRDISRYSTERSMKKAAGAGFWYEG